MKSFKLDGTNDIVLNDKKEIEIITGAEEVAQRSEITLSINKGGWFLDINLGVSWMDLFNDNATVNKISDEVRNILLQDNAINTVDFINIDLEDRILSIDLRGSLINNDNFTYNLELEV